MRKDNAFVFFFAQNERARYTDTYSSAFSGLSSLSSHLPILLYFLSFYLFQRFQ
jgi:hypothetical protein